MMSSSVGLFGDSFGFVIWGSFAEFFKEVLHVLVGDLVVGRVVDAELCEDAIEFRTPRSESDDGGLVLLRGDDGPVEGFPNRRILFVAAAIRRAVCVEKVAKMLCLLPVAAW